MSTATSSERPVRGRMALSQVTEPVPFAAYATEALIAADDGAGVGMIDSRRAASPPRLAPLKEFHETYAAPQTMASDKVVDMRHETTAAESISLGQDSKRDADKGSIVAQILCLLDEQKLLLVAGQDTRMIETQLVVLREQLEMERRAAEQLRAAAIEADKVKTSSTDGSTGEKESTSEPLVDISQVDPHATSEASRVLSTALVTLVLLATVHKVVVRRVHTDNAKAHVGGQR